MTTYKYHAPDGRPLVYRLSANGYVCPHCATHGGYANLSPVPLSREECLTCDVCDNTTYGDEDAFAPEGNGDGSPM